MAELLRAETPGEALALLERHAQRRRAGLPTLSVLAGPAGLGARLWRAWAERVRRPVVQTGDPSAGAVAAAVAAAAARRRDLAADALRFVAGRAGEPRLAARAEWEHLTQHEFELRWQNLSLDPGHDPAAALCHRLTRALAAGEPVSATTVTSGPNPVAALAALLPPEALPALILVPAPASADPAAWLRRAAEVLGELAAAVPALPAAVAAEADAVSRYLAAEPESRAKALVREGAVAVPHLSEAAVRDQIRETGAADDVPEATVRRLAEGGASPELVRSLAETAKALREAEPDRARSAAERFLYDLLESHPQTGGLFALNAPLGFRFGRAEAEADLLAGDLRLAVEIDGYYHFTDRESYRRDRRKDWELQRRGYLVLRFLAEDVVARMEEILETILAAVEYRRQRPPTEEENPA